MLVELVTHCHSGPSAQYAKLLLCQLASIRRNPPRKVRLEYTLFVCHDQSEGLLNSALDRLLPECPWLNVVTLSAPYLLQRPIGRNERAKSTTADLIWFCDCDYLCGPGCLDSLSDIDLGVSPLFFPRIVLASKTYEHGQRTIDAIQLNQPLEVPGISPDDFIPHRYGRAIGGVQLVRGDDARRVGYVPDLQKFQTPTSGNAMCGFSAEPMFRRRLGTRGAKADIGPLYRLRHALTADHRSKVKP